MNASWHACNYRSVGMIHLRDNPLIDNLTLSDPFLVLADYAASIACHEQVSAAWQDPENWTRMSILNAARSGKLSSDRAIGEHCEEIGNLPPVTVKL